MNYKKATTLLGFAIALGLSGTSYAEDSLENMISPMSHPTQFEDPRQSTELRPIFMHNSFDNTFPTSGGDAQLYLLQGRAKLTEDLSLIVTKFGLIHVNPDEADSETGMSNLDVGLKYSPLVCESDILSLGLRYDIPVGDDDVSEGEGSGTINPFISFGGQKEGINYILYTGLRNRVESEDSSFWDIHGHLSYPIEKIVPFVELNLVHVYQDGTRIPTAAEGVDIWNFGSVYSAGTNTTSMSVGARYLAEKNLDFGLGYEFPIDRGRGDGVLDWRIMLDAIYRFEI